MLVSAFPEPFQCHHATVPLTLSPAGSLCQLPTLLCATHAVVCYPRCCVLLACMCCLLVCAAGEALRALGYTVVTVENPSASELSASLIAHASQQDWQSHASSVVALMAHGYDATIECQVRAATFSPISTRAKL